MATQKEEPVEEAFAVITNDYSIELSEPDNLMRVSFADEDGVVSAHVMNAPEAYSFAQAILRGYDKLEGIA